MCVHVCVSSYCKQWRQKEPNRRLEPASPNWDGRRKCGTANLDFSQASIPRKQDEADWAQRSVLVNS